jgi:hypothetical protein
MDRRLQTNPWPEMSGISLLKDLELLENQRSAVNLVQM